MAAYAIAFGCCNHVLGFATTVPLASCAKAHGKSLESKALSILCLAEDLLEWPISASKRRRISATTSGGAAVFRRGGLFFAKGVDSAH
jgi:hypothetical protein